MGALTALLAAAGAEALLAVLILWRSSRREAAIARRVDAQMADAMAELRQRTALRRQFQEIVDRNWPEGAER